MEVRQLGIDEVASAADVLCDAFRSYSMGKYVLGPSPDYTVRLRSFLTYFVRGTILRDEWLFGVGTADDLKAVAATSRAHARSPATLLELREALWAELGDEARARYEACSRAVAHLSLDEPHLHLSLIGVRTVDQGRGLARVLLEAIHALSADDEASRGVAVSTESEAVVPMYEHFGYRLVGEAPIRADLSVRVLYRPNGR